MRRVYPEASQDIQATVFGVSEEEQFAEGIPYSPSPRPKEVWPWRYMVRGPRKMSVESFLDAVFEDRIKYGLPDYTRDPEGWHVTTKG